MALFAYIIEKITNIYIYFLEDIENVIIFAASLYVCVCVYTCVFLEIKTRIYKQFNKLKLQNEEDLFICTCSSSCTRSIFL